MVILQGMLSDLNKATPTPAISSDTAQSITEQASKSGTWESFVQLVGLVFLLIIILIAAYFTSRFIGEMKLGQLKNSNFKIIDSYRISPNKVIQIVKIANKYIVIAISKDTVDYITELDETEVIVREANIGEKLSFRQTLEKLRNNK